MSKHAPGPFATAIDAKSRRIRYTCRECGKRLTVCTWLPAMREVTNELGAKVLIPDRSRVAVWWHPCDEGEAKLAKAEKRNE